MKLIALIWLLSLSLQGQWITGVYSAQNGVLPISNIPWSKYTHIIHFAAAPNSDGTVSMYSLTQSNIDALIASRPAGKKVIVEMADTGCCWSQATNSPGTIAAYVKNIVTFVNSNGYDGVDLDWEHNINTTQYVDLVTRLRNAMPTKLITMAVNADMTAAAAASQSKLDQVNAMCYDMDSWPGTASWYNGALNGPSNYWSCATLTAKLTAAGVAPTKIGIGIPFYGRRWSGCTQVLVSPCTKQGYFAYRDLVADTTRWRSQHRRYDIRYHSNYLSIPSLNEFDSYNGPEFMPDVVAWAKAKGFGGFLTFTIEYEYLSTQTGDAHYPLSTALNKAVFDTAPLPPSHSNTTLYLYIGVTLLLAIALVGVWLRKDAGDTSALKTESQ